MDTLVEINAAMQNALMLIAVTRLSNCPLGEEYRTSSTVAR